MDNFSNKKKVAVISHIIPFDGILLDFLEREKGYGVLFTASTFEVFFKKVEKHDALDRVFVEIDDWDENALSQINKVMRQNLKAELVILSNFCEPDYLLRVMRAGASGYVLRNEDLAAFGRELDRLDQNGGHISPDAITFMSQHFRQVGQGHPMAQRFSSRHKRILDLLAAGETFASAREKMGLSLYCFRYHVKQISRECNADNISAVIRSYKHLHDRAA